MRVLVVGGTQFNGLALVRELVRTGHDVTVLNRGRTQVELPRGVSRLVCDRTDPAAMRVLLGGCEFDCVQDMTAYHPEDVELAVELFRGRVGHYIFASSTVIYATARILPIGEDHPTERGPDQVEYGLHKLLCEDVLIREYREHAFPATIVPFSMVMGPRNLVPDREQRMFIRLLQGREVLIPGHGAALGQICYVDDQARALRMLMGNPITFGKRYNVTGRQWFTDEGYVDTIAAVLGVDARKVFVPAPVMDALWDGELTLAAGQATAPLVDLRTSPEAAQRQAVFERRMQLSQLIQKLSPHLYRWDDSAVFSTERIRRDIGWEADYSFAAAVEHTYDWFRREGLDRTSHFDFTFEDNLLAHLRTP